MDTRIVESPATRRVIRVHADDNVAIVANDFGLPVGARLPCSHFASACLKAIRWPWSTSPWENRSAVTMS